MEFINNDFEESKYVQDASQRIGEQPGKKLNSITRPLGLGPRSKGIVLSNSSNKHNVTVMNDPKANQQYVKDWIQETGITKEKLLNEYCKKLKNSGLQRNPMITIEKFCEFFNCGNTECSECFFTLFLNKESRTGDIYKHIISLSSLLFTSMQELLKFQFELVDRDKSCYLTYNDLLLILQANNFVSNQKEILYKAKTIFSNSEKLMQEDTLSEDEFYRLANEMPDLMFLSPII